MKQEAFIFWCYKNKLYYAFKKKNWKVEELTNFDKRILDYSKLMVEKLPSMKEEKSQ